MPDDLQTFSIVLLLLYGIGKSPQISQESSGKSLVRTFFIHLYLVEA